MFQVQKHHYFDSRRDRSIVSLSALNTDEREINGVLATLLKGLKRIHTMFFNPKFEAGLEYRDVRFILARS